MFYAPSKVDKDGKFAEFLSETQWKALKDNIEEYYSYIKSLDKDAPKI